MRKKGKKPEDIGNIISKVIKKLDKKTHGSAEDVIKAWQKAIEPKAVCHTSPVLLKKNILTIEVDSSTWLYFLSLKKKSILEDMKKTLGERRIEDIRFRIGEIS